MPVPTYDKFIEPILRHLADHPQGAVARDVHEAAATALGLTDEDRQERLPSGVQPVYKNRADLMIDHEVGVTMRPLRVPKIDNDYFEEESA